MSYYNSNNINNLPRNYTFQGPRVRHFGPPASNFGSPLSRNFAPPPLQYSLPPMDIVPPPPPPPFFPVLPAPVSDQDFIRQFENPSLEQEKTKLSNISINSVKENLRNLVLTLNKLKEKEKYFKENINEISEAEWTTEMDLIKENKLQINKTLSQINDEYLETLRKLLTKRSAKRMRLKRLREERKKEKEEWIKGRQERSRKIDENLQKIKDDIDKAKQEEKAKLEADVVLKEVLRQKLDAKKCIAKLDAMQRLYRARQNTARGRGDTVSEANLDSFNSNIEKLKAVWAQKLVLYEKEEAQLRTTLKDNETQNTSIKDEVLMNLEKWKEFLFGCSAGPQLDFQGDIGKFVQVRSDWDQYISDAGTPLPLGWVVPNLVS